MLGHTASAQFRNKVRLNGYSSFVAEYAFQDNGLGDPNASFDADLIDLVFNVQATNRLRFNTDITWEHGADTQDKRGNVVLQYAFPEYTVNDWLKVRVGKMFVPFGIYNEIRNAKPAFFTVEEPFSTNKNEEFGSAMRFYPRWASGIAVIGNGEIRDLKLDYNVQISNGEQALGNPFEVDDNLQKALATRVRIRPLTNLRIGVSGYADWLTELDSTGKDSGGRTHLLSYGGQLEYELQNAGVELEFIGGSIDRSDAPPTNRMAYTLMMYYTIGKRFIPYARIGYLDPSMATDLDEATMISVGLNIELDHNFYLKLQYNNISSEPNNMQFFGKDLDQIQASIAVGF